MFPWGGQFIWQIQRQIKVALHGTLIPQEKGQTPLPFCWYGRGNALYRDIRLDYGLAFIKAHDQGCIALSGCVLVIGSYNKRVSPGRLEKSRQRELRRYTLVNSELLPCSTREGTAFNVDRYLHGMRRNITAIFHRHCQHGFFRGRSQRVPRDHGD